MWSSQTCTGCGETMKHARAEWEMTRTPARAAKMYMRVNAARVLIGLSPLEKRQFEAHFLIRRSLTHGSSAGRKSFFGFKRRNHETHE